MENNYDKCNKKLKKIKLQNFVEKESCAANEYISMCKENLKYVFKDVNEGSTAISKFILF